MLQDDKKGQTVGMLGFAAGADQLKTARGDGACIALAMARKVVGAIAANSHA